MFTILLNCCRVGNPIIHYNIRATYIYLKFYTLQSCTSCMKKETQATSCHMNHFIRYLKVILTSCLVILRKIHATSEIFETEIAALEEKLWSCVDDTLKILASNDLKKKSCEKQLHLRKADKLYHLKHQSAKKQNGRRHCYWLSKKFTHSKHQYQWRILFLVMFTYYQICSQFSTCMTNQ